MHISPKISIYFMLGLVFCSSPSLFAQVVLRDPGIQEREILEYRTKTGDKVIASTVTTRREQVGSSQRYRVSSNSIERDSVLVIDLARMLVIQSETTRRSKEATIKSTSELITTSAVAGRNEILVADFNGLAEVLRGLPFDTFRTAKLKFASGEGIGIDLEVRSVGQQRITVPAGTFDCYQIQVSAGGLLGGFVGKSIMWFSVEAPHFLVKSEGPSGGPGSPASIAELTVRR